MTNTTPLTVEALLQALDILDDEGRLRKRATELAAHIQSRKPSAEATYIAARLIENHAIAPTPAPAADVVEEQNDLIDWIDDVTARDGIRHPDGSPLLWPRRVVRALLAEVERLTGELHFAGKDSPRLVVQGHDELVATLTAREAELARVRKVVQTWRSRGTDKDFDTFSVRAARLALRECADEVVAALASQPTGDKV